MTAADAPKEKISVAALNWLTLLGSVALVIVAFHGSRARVAHEARLRSPLADLPAGAELEAIVNLDRLRQSPLGATLTDDGRTLPGIGRLDDVCGFDPSRQIRSLGVTIAAAPGERVPNFGVAATGHFSARRISACARAVIRRRGGVPVQTRVGSFVTVRDEKGHGGEIAVRDGGPVLLGAGSYLLAMVDAADGRAPAASSDAFQAALQRAVGKRGTLVVSAVLPADWPERWAGTELARASGLSKVRAVALRLDLAPSVEARAVIGCSAVPSCQAVRRVLDRLVAGWLTPRLEHALGRPLTHPIRVRAAPREVRIDLDLAQPEAHTLLERLAAVLGPTPNTPAR